MPQRIGAFGDSHYLEKSVPLRTLRVEWDEANELASDAEEWIATASASIRSFWDARREKMQTGWVECDYRFVAQALNILRELDQRDPPRPQRIVEGPFVEWGSGFAVVAGLAAIMGIDATGIESEGFLHRAALRLHERTALNTTLVQGNFIPEGAEGLAESSDPRVSLAAPAGEAYSQLNRTLADYRMVFVYAWPGEEHFLKLVFERFAKEGAVLLLYRGPYHLEVYRKV